MADQNVNIYINARDNASGAFRNVKQSAAGMVEGLDKIKNKTAQVVGAVGLLTAAFAGGFKIGQFIGEAIADMDTFKAKVVDLWQSWTDARYNALKNIQEGTGGFRESEIAKASREAKERSMGVDPASKEREAFLKRQADREEQQLKSKEALIKSIEDEAHALGKTKQELELYKLAQLGASDADYEWVKVQQDKIKATEEAEQAIVNAARRQEIQKQLTENQAKADERDLAKRIHALQEQRAGITPGQQSQDLFATQSRFLTRGTVRTEDPQAKIAAGIDKQIKELQNQLEAMKEQKEVLDQIAENTRLQEELAGI